MKEKRNTMSITVFIVSFNMAVSFGKHWQILKRDVKTLLTRASVYTLLMNNNKFSNGIIVSWMKLDKIAGVH